MKILAFGEGYHNYHHVYPTDYKTSAPGVWLNPSTHVIDFFAWIGWAKDLKEISPEAVEKRKQENLKSLEEYRHPKSG